jgi:hypothetical protein
MKTVIFMLMLDYRISVTNHIPRGNECCYGRYLWFPAGKVRFRTNPKITGEGFLGFPFSLDGVYFVFAVQSGCLPPCYSGSRNSWQVVTCLIHATKPSPGPQALTRETWQGGVFRSSVHLGEQSVRTPVGARDQITVSGCSTTRFFKRDKPEGSDRFIGTCFCTSDDRSMMITTPGGFVSS